MGTGSITALGTQFQVQHDENQITVTLINGLVLIEQHDATGSLHEERLRPGGQVVYSTDGSYWSKHTIDPTAVTGWASGRPVFRGAPITEALTEINRYATYKIRLGDPSLQRLEISGTFALGDSSSVAVALTQVLPVRVANGPDGIVLLPKGTSGRDGDSRAR